jgi:DNA-binding NtrC family response regulator
LTQRPVVLLFDEDTATTELGRSRLTEAGFAVTCARSFLDALPHLGSARADIVLIALPEDAWTRSALLAQLRRANPLGTIVAMTHSTSDELSELLHQFDVAVVPPVARERWHDAVDAIREALGTSELDGLALTPTASNDAADGS